MVKDPEPRKLLGDLLRSVDEGEFVIPHFQRGFEWTPGMVSDLLVSIIQDYFTGLVLFWEFEPALFKKEKWDQLWGTHTAEIPTLAILDGQQRLASLYYALYGPAKKFPTRDSYYTFYIDLRKYLQGDYEECIYYRYYSNYVPVEKIKNDRDKWIEECVLPLRIISDRKYIDSNEFNEWTRGYARKLAKDSKDMNEYDALRDAVKGAAYKILDYEVLTHTLGKDRELPDICGIFAKINQKGMKLSTFDLMNAFLYPKDISLRKNWDAFENEDLKKADSNMNEYLLKLISLYKQGYCSSKYIYYLIPDYKIKKRDEEGKFTELVLVNSKDEFVKLWNDACEYAGDALERIMNIGKNDFGAVKSDFIPNTTIIPVIGAIMLFYDKNYTKAISKEEFDNMLNKWYWSAVISGDYSGSSDSVMSEDFRDITTWFEKKDISKIRRINKVNEQFVKGLNLRTYDKGSTLYNCLLCSIALNKAEDFYTTRTLDTGSFREERIHDHHIFPKKAEGYPKETTKDFSTYHDSILNRTLLLDETNHSIEASRPSQYLEEIKKVTGGDRTKLKSLMEKHLISNDALEFMEKDNFDNFIVEREKTMKQKLLSFLT